MSLVERIRAKAKTLLYWWEKSTEPRFFELELVKVVDVLSEFNKTEREWAEANELLARTVKFQERQSKERKQKLQQWFNNAQPFMDDSEAKKFEELLKE